MIADLVKTETRHAEKRAKLLADQQRQREVSAAAEAAASEHQRRMISARAHDDVSPTVHHKVLSF
jgi:hypothetical protein